MSKDIQTALEGMEGGEEKEEEGEEGKEEEEEKESVDENPSPGESEPPGDVKRTHPPVSQSHLVM